MHPLARVRPNDKSLPARVSPMLATLVRSARPRAPPPPVARLLRAWPHRRLVATPAGGSVGADDGAGSGATGATGATGTTAGGGAAGSSSAAAAAGFTDIAIDEQSWVRRYLPAAAEPYASLGRWDRPIGTWLLLWPCLWSTALAAPAGAPPDAALCALFGVGAFAMRGAGCTVNDLWDRDIDAQVERTAARPLASGALGVRHALGFLLGQVRSPAISSLLPRSPALSLLL